MRLKSLEIAGFKSFAKKESLEFESSICAIVGPNGSGKSNTAEAFRFVLGEQSMKSMRGKKGEDLIFNGNQSVGSQSRASVKLVFDNKDKLLKIDFDEVEIQRVVHKDGANEYFLNNSKVRLKDIQELLTGANIGASGHHIISQGEADRILNTSIKERKSILEDALGLRVFEYKKNEAIRKLEKTKENIKEVESLRREIAPHLKFLKKQVEKVEKANQLKKDLNSLYTDYLSREEFYLNKKSEILEKEIIVPKKSLEEIGLQIESIKKNSELRAQGSEGDELIKLKEELSNFNHKKFDLADKISRIEGQITSLSQLMDEEQKKNTDSVLVSKNELMNMKDEISSFKNQIDSETDISRVKELFGLIFSKLNSFVDKFSENKTSDLIQGTKIKVQNLTKEKEELKGQLESLEKEIKALDEPIKLAEEKSKEAPQDQMEIIDLMNKKNDLEITVRNINSEIRQINEDKEELKREISEGIVLCGREILNYENYSVDETILNEDRVVQKNKRKELERMKIRLEEMGIGGGQDIMKEFEETTERDNFLESEIDDLRKSSSSLEDLIKDLEEEISKRFKTGLDNINKEFTKFFGLMFGGGEATLKLVREEIRSQNSEFEEIEDREIQYEEGVDIHVNLPRKKIKGLMMLSGGERALTSIALLFAMSAVNPPPFIILDETDAALDEANSRKYGDMIEDLSKHSQLILITHNRETMSRAGIIYGVTMQQGVSQVLSIKFDEAVEVAK